MLINARVEDAPKYIHKQPFGNISLICYFLDFMFCDWEYGVTSSNWDRKQTLQGINSRLSAFEQVNSSRETVAYQWAFMSNISDLLEGMITHNWKKNHNWVSIAVDKHEKTTKPFYYQTTQVSFHSSFHLCRFLYRNSPRNPSSATTTWEERMHQWPTQTLFLIRKPPNVSFYFHHSQHVLIHMEQK